MEKVPHGLRRSLLPKGSFCVRMLHLRIQNEDPHIESCVFVLNAMVTGGGQCREVLGDSTVAFENHSENSTLVETEYFLLSFADKHPVPLFSKVEGARENTSMFSVFDLYTLTHDRMHFLMLLSDS